MGQPLSMGFAHEAVGSDRWDELSSRGGAVRGGAFDGDLLTGAMARDGQLCAQATGRRHALAPSRGTLRGDAGAVASAQGHHARRASRGADRHRSDDRQFDAAPLFARHSITRKKRPVTRSRPEAGPGLVREPARSCSRAPGVHRREDRDQHGPQPRPRPEGRAPADELPARSPQDHDMVAACAPLG